tara:strand:- start:726 stop:899 length:174 start_codon:yes stop_codon:yes gene_type:complete
MTKSRKLNAYKNIHHLYNPKTEGLGSYDVNYINAYKKQLKAKQKQIKKSILSEREAA